MYENDKSSENYATLTAKYSEGCERYEGQFWYYEPVNSARSGSWFDRGPIREINILPGKYKIGYSCDVVFNEKDGKCDEWIFFHNPPSFKARFKKGNKYLVYCDASGSPGYTKINESK